MDKAVNNNQSIAAPYSSSLSYLSTPAPTKAQTYPVITAAPAIKSYENKANILNQLDRDISIQSVNRGNNSVTPTLEAQNGSQPMFPATASDELTRIKTDPSFSGGKFYGKTPGGIVDLATGAIVDAATGQPVQNTTKTDTTGSQLSSQLSEIDKQRTAVNAQLDAEINQHKADLNNLRNGTFPLSPDQQAQLNDVQAQFDVLKEKQMTANRNFEGGTTQYTIRMGLNKYSPVMAEGVIKNAVDTGIKKIQDLDAKATAAVSKLRSAFQSNNLKLVETAYKDLTTALYDKRKELDTLQKSVTDYNLKLNEYNRKVANDTFNADIKSDRLTLDEKKQKFNEYMRSAELTEKERNNAVDEFQAQEKIDLQRRKQAVDEYYKAHPELKAVKDYKLTGKDTIKLQIAGVPQDVAQTIVEQLKTKTPDEVKAMMKQAGIDTALFDKTVNYINPPKKGTGREL